MGKIVIEADGSKWSIKKMNDGGVKKVRLG